MYEAGAQERFKQEKSITGMWVADEGMGEAWTSLGKHQDLRAKQGNGCL